MNPRLKTREPKLTISHAAPEMLRRCTDTRYGAELPAPGYVALAAPGLACYANYTYLFLLIVLALSVVGLDKLQLLAQLAGIV